MPWMSQQIDNESGLLQNAQALVRRNPHQVQDARGFLRAQRHVGRAGRFPASWPSGTFEAIEQKAGRGVSTPPNGSSMPRSAIDASRRAFAGVVPQAMPLIPQVQARKFHVFGASNAP